uniref:Protein BTG1 n=1 Tax=Apteryx owenii TaxID=8824 RepID=A0A8B9PNI3_APTOW
MHPALYTRASMIREIAAAVSFISKFLRTKGLMNERQLQTFSQSLQELLAEHYKHHWFPEKPCKGSGYRCIRINHKMDPLIGQAAQRIGLSSQELFQLLPSELTLWVDPYEVSYRIGEDGSICVLYEAAPAGALREFFNLDFLSEVLLFGEVAAERRELEKLDCRKPEMKNLLWSHTHFATLWNCSTLEEIISNMFPEFQEHALVQWEQWKFISEKQQGLALPMAASHALCPWVAHPTLMRGGI